MVIGNVINSLMSKFCFVVRNLDDYFSDKVLHTYIREPDGRKYYDKTPLKPIREEVNRVLDEIPSLGLSDDQRQYIENSFTCLNGLIDSLYNLKFLGTNTSSRGLREDFEAILNQCYSIGEQVVNPPHRSIGLDEAPCKEQQLVVMEDILYEPSQPSGEFLFESIRKQIEICKVCPYKLPLAK